MLNKNDGEPDKEVIQDKSVEMNDRSKAYLEKSLSRASLNDVH